MSRETGTEDERVSEEELHQRRLRAGAMMLDIALAFVVLLGALTALVIFLQGEPLIAGIVGAITVVFLLLAIPRMVSRRRELNDRSNKEWREDG